MQLCHMSQAEGAFELVTFTHTRVLVCFRFITDPPGETPQRPDVWILSGREHGLGSELLPGPGRRVSL